MKRESFIRQGALLAAGAVIGPVVALAIPSVTRPINSSGRRSLLDDPFISSADASPGSAQAFIQSREGVTILYTNDTHSRLDPFPQNAIEHAGLGGVSRRATLIRQIRDSGRQTLLLDAGGVFQGSPWFHMYGGVRSFELMSMMGYDAMCPGEHEFSNGVDGLVEAALYADFPFLCANYETNHPGLSALLQESIIRDYEGIRIGIFGLGIDLDGLIDPTLVEGVACLDPVETATNVAAGLREGGQCDYVICLSHLGYSNADERIDDRNLASRVSGIDLIIGGHTHTFLDEPVPVQSPDGRKTLITQVGHSGIRLGRMDLVTSGDGQVTMLSSGTYPIE